MKKFSRFIKFLIIDVAWVGLKFYLTIPSDIWKEFNKKENEKRI